MRDSVGWQQGAERQQGGWGESGVRRYLEAHGNAVIPVNLIEDGGAPAVTSYLSRLVLPDLDVSNEHGRAWWEVKTKSKPDYYGKAREWRHGIEKRTWVEYLAVVVKTHTPGWLAIVERDSQILLVAPFEHLRRYVHPHLGLRDAYGGAEMVFFSRDDFEVIAEGDEWLDVPPWLPRPVSQPPHPWQQGRPLPGPVTQPRLEFE